jgi:hypothetical protein
VSPCSAFLPLRCSLANFFLAQSGLETWYPGSVSYIASDDSFIPLCPATSEDGVSQAVCPGWPGTGVP